MLRNILEERISYLHRCGSLKSRFVTLVSVPCVVFVVSFPKVPCFLLFFILFSVVVIFHYCLSFLCYCSFLPFLSTCWIIYVGVLGIITGGICADIWSAVRYETGLLIISPKRSISMYLRQLIKARWKPVLHSCHSKQKPNLKHKLRRGLLMNHDFFITHLCYILENILHRH